MTLNISNNYLQSLISQGNDAYKNLYLVDFIGGSLSEVNGALQVRCSGIDLPKHEGKTYPVKFINEYIDRPLPTMQDFERKFSLTFRVDANFTAYNKLLEMQSKNFIPSIGFTNAKTTFTDTDSDLFQVKVSILNDTDVSNKIDISGSVENSSSLDGNKKKTIFYFKKCWIDNISAPTYDYSDSAAQTVTVSINFMDFEDWQSPSVSNK